MVAPVMVAALMIPTSLSSFFFEFKKPHRNWGRKKEKPDSISTKMSCNGCRVLRRGCSEECIIRPCLEWIQSPQAQGNATLFVSKFFGRSDLLSFIAAVPENKRPALFQSLLYEACGRTVNPVDGAVGLLSSGNWGLCQAAVETVFAGGVLRPAEELRKGGMQGNCMENTASFGSGISEVSPESVNGVTQVGSKKPKLLNLFA